MLREPAPALPDALVDVHRRQNRRMAASWTASADHRARVTHLVRGAAPEDGSGRLCVLGAGNCNDLDVEGLADAFASVHLVDIDAEAVRRAVDRQSAAVRRRVVVHAPLDVTGAMGAIEGWAHATPSPAAVADLSDAGVGKILAALPGRFDVVVSTCLLSRMMWTCATAMGERHQALRAVACALELGHLRATAALVRDGGAGIFVIDTVDSDRYPLDALYDPRHPTRVLQHLAATRMHFAGTDPALLEQVFHDDAALAARVGPLRIVAPWLWTAETDRTMLVYALMFRAGFIS
jgi:hypothetical protein